MINRDSIHSILNGNIIEYIENKYKNNIEQFCHRYFQKLNIIEDNKEINGDLLYKYNISHNIIKYNDIYLPSFSDNINIINTIAIKYDNIIMLEVKNNCYLYFTLFLSIGEISI
jgi:hypothetical protein